MSGREKKQRIYNFFTPLVVLALTLVVAACGGNATPVEQPASQEQAGAAPVAAAAEEESVASSEEASTTEEVAEAVTEEPREIIASVGRIGGVDELIDISEVCGDKPMRVALADGFGGNSWRKITRAEFEDEAGKCSNITEIIYVDGQNNPQKAISDLQGLVAQGVEVVVIFPDHGPAMLPAIREAYNAGTSIVAYTASPGGTPGQDYVDFIAPNTPNDGASWAKWVAENLNGEGKVIFLGGTPGNLQSQAELEGIQEVFAEYPNIELLAGPVDTNWDPAETQRVVAGLLTQYPQIDAIISDYGGGSVGGVRAFLQAGRWSHAGRGSDSANHQRHHFFAAQPGLAVLAAGPADNSGRSVLFTGTQRVSS